MIIRIAALSNIAFKLVGSTNWIAEIQYQYIEEACLRRAERKITFTTCVNTLAFIRQILFNSYVGRVVPELIIFDVLLGIHCIVFFFRLTRIFSSGVIDGIRVISQNSVKFK